MSASRGEVERPADPAAQAGAAEQPSKKRVVVLYNHTGDDWYEKLRNVDMSKLGFEPQYPITDVATVKEEHKEIARALRAAGFKARAVNLQNDLRKLERLLRRDRPDVIFNLVEYFHDDAGLEASIAGMFDLYQIPYTGAPPFALELCQRKGLTKKLLKDYKVPTPRFVILDEPKLPAKLGVSLPIILKPAWEDASAGIGENSVVYDEGQLAVRLQHLYEEFEQPILVEEFIDGRELHVAVWGNDPVEVLPPIEFDFSEIPPGHPPIVSYEAKWDPLAEVYHRIHTVCPAPLTKRQRRRIEQVVVRAYEVTECRDYARLDIRLQGNKPYVLEVNPNPDLTENVSFMEAAEVAGHTFSEALAWIVEFASERAPTPHHPHEPQGDPPSSRVADLTPTADPDGPRTGPAEEAPDTDPHSPHEPQAAANPEGQESS